MLFRSERDEALVVPDLSADDRFNVSPALMGAGLRFYAGQPLHAGEHRVGVLCVMGYEEREMSDAELRARIPAGRADAPITIAGTDPSGRFATVLRAATVVLQINHSYYHVQGLTVDGQPSINRQRFPATLDAARAFKESLGADVANSKLIYIGYAPASRDITGVVLDNLFLDGSGGECVRRRNNAFGNIVEHSVIEWCGLEI